MRMSGASIAAIMAGCIATSAYAADDLIVVFDGSNSMWGQIDGTAKIDIARGVIDNLVTEITPETNVGLMAYGHRRRGDCTDIEMMLPPAPLDVDTFLANIAAITPTGKTPLTDAVRQAAEALSYRDTAATVILISDGLESCERDPCSMAAELERAGIGFTAHVVGFGLGADEDARSLSCIADETGGQFLSAANADELGAALSTVGAAVAQAEPEPAPEPTPPMLAVTLTGPDSVTQGAAFDLGWDPVADDPQDYVTIVPVDAKDDESASYIRVRDDSSGLLVAPAETGLYELRYILDADRSVAGRTAIEVLPADVTLTGPDTALAGSAFEVSWTGTVHPQDYVTIVPMGAAEGESGDYVRVSDKDTDSLTAPAETGLYELRYVLDEGRRTMASAQIEVTEPEVTVSGPAQIRVGDPIAVSWTGAVNAQDYVTVVPAGSAADASGDYQRVQEGTSGELTAPDAPGLYELRYILDEGRRVLATHDIEVLPADAQLSTGAHLDVPQSAKAGAEIAISWSGLAEAGDQRVTIAEADQPIFTWMQAIPIDGPPPLSMTMPDTPGRYELRLLDVTQKEVLARAPIIIE